MITIDTRALWRLLLTLALAAMMLGCDKNPVGTDDDEDDEERGPDGVPALVVRR